MGQCQEFHRIPVPQCFLTVFMLLSERTQPGSGKCRPWHSEMVSQFGKKDSFGARSSSSESSLPLFRCGAQFGTKTFQSETHAGGASSSLVTGGQIFFVMVKLPFSCFPFRRIQHPYWNMTHERKTFQKAFHILSQNNSTEPFI